MMEMETTTVNQRKLNLQKIFETKNWKVLAGDVQQKFRTLFAAYGFTYQEMNLSLQHAIDLTLWQEKNFFALWDEYHHRVSNQPQNRQQTKKQILSRIQTYIDQTRSSPVRYDQFRPSPPRLRALKLERRRNERDKIFGFCPVASSKTVCCNLRTIDAVRNCSIGCNYCAIQTMFPDGKAIVDQDFSKKLSEIQLDPNRFYHFGTGQSSDALVWGNSFQQLQDLLAFAKKWPNILLEFKTKTDNTRYLEQNPVPKNVCCSWSLNPPTIIQAEEHHSAPLQQRLNAARRVADLGIKVCFHFHPIFYYEGWKEDYGQLYESVLSRFRPDEILFISFGTLTFPKPVLNKIREKATATKVFMMPTSLNPEGKITYAPEIKEALFEFAYQCFSAWHQEVFFYLCMEERRFWLSTFGRVYESNDDFEREMGKACFSKIEGPRLAEK